MIEKLNIYIVIPLIKYVLDDDRNVLSISDETDDSDSADSGELPCSYRPAPTMHPSSIGRHPLN